MCVGPGSVAKVGGSLLGASFGKLGTVVPNPRIAIGEVTEYFAGRMAQRGVTMEMLQETLKNPVVVLEQTRGRYLFISNEAAVVVNNAGTAITTYSRQYYDAAIQSILKLAK